MISDIEIVEFKVNPKIDPDHYQIEVTVRLMKPTRPWHRYEYDPVLQQHVAVHKPSFVPAEYRLVFEHQNGRYIQFWWQLPDFSFSIVRQTWLTPYMQVDGVIYPTINAALRDAFDRLALWAGATA